MILDLCVKQIMIVLIHFFLSRMDESESHSKFYKCVGSGSVGYGSSFLLRVEFASSVEYGCFSFEKKTPDRDNFHPDSQPMPKRRLVEECRTHGTQISWYIKNRCASEEGNQ